MHTNVCACVYEIGAHYQVSEVNSCICLLVFHILRAKNITNFLIAFFMRCYFLDEITLLNVLREKMTHLLMLLACAHEIPGEDCTVTDNCSGKGLERMLLFSEAERDHKTLR